MYSVANNHDGINGGQRNALTLEYDQNGHQKYDKGNGHQLKQLRYNEKSNSNSINAHRYNQNGSMMGMNRGSNQKCAPQLNGQNSLSINSR